MRLEALITLEFYLVSWLDNMMVCVRSGVKDDNTVSRKIRHCCCEHAELLFIYAGFVHLKLETL